MGVDESFQISLTLGDKTGGLSAQVSSICLHKIDPTSDFRSKEHTPDAVWLLGWIGLCRLEPACIE